MKRCRLCESCEGIDCEVMAEMIWLEKCYEEAGPIYPMRSEEEMAALDHKGRP